MDPSPLSAISRRTFLVGAAVAAARVPAQGPPPEPETGRPRKGAAREGEQQEPVPDASSGPHSLTELAYRPDELKPALSSRTLSFHHGKHHQAFVDRLNELVADSELAGLRLPDLVRFAAADRESELFRCAAETWNHDFYWKSIRPGGGGRPTAELGRRISDSFGSFEAFRKVFIETTTARFGSGWGWLVADSGKLSVIDTPNADSPLLANRVPLLAIDLWEHAYYLDYQNRRYDYAVAFLDKLVDWDFVARNLAQR